MVYIKEFFSFGKKKSKDPLTWKEKLSKLEEIFNKKEDSECFSNTNIKSDNNFYLSYSNYEKGIFYTLFFNNSDVTDMDNIKDKIEITSDEFNKAKKLAQNISKWLDDESDLNSNISKTALNDDGSIDFNQGELALDELNYTIGNELFNKHIDKSFEFEIGYYHWTEESKNSFIVDRFMLNINKLEIEFNGDKFYLNIESDINNDVINMMIEEDTLADYIDIEKQHLNKSKKSIYLYKVEPEMTRREKRDYDNTFPKNSYFDISPSKYDSIELIKEIKVILELLNNEIKKKR